MMEDRRWNQIRTDRSRKKGDERRFMEGNGRS